MTDLEIRRKRLYFQANHRGCLEADLMMGAFAERRLPQLNQTELDQFEAILEADDGEVIGWLLGTRPIPPNYNATMVAEIRGGY